MSENSTLNVTILVGVCLVIIRKVAKLLQKRQSECGLSTPCLKLWVDLEDQHVPHEPRGRSELNHPEEADDEADDEAESSSIEEKSSTYSDSNSLTEHMKALDSLDFVELESKLMKLVTE